jgi:hypothetical protein
MKRIDERIAGLEDKLKRLRARHQRAETRRKRLEAQEAKRAEQRRRLLIGSIVLDKVKRGEVDDAEFRKWLHAGLTRPADRALFNL